MPTLTTYTKATEANILANPPTADGEMAFSTDTKKLFISEGTEWRYWQADKSIGKYQLGSELVSRPVYHIDPSQSSYLFDENGLNVTNGGSIAKIKDQITGRFIEAPNALSQPTYIGSAGTTPLALPNGDARINGLPVMQFDGISQYLEPSIEMIRDRSHSNGITYMAVFRQTPQRKTADSSTDSTYWVNRQYTPVLGVRDAISFTPRNDTNASNYIYTTHIGAINMINMNKYEGDQGECSLITSRFANNPNSSSGYLEIRHITSLGSQKTYGNEYYRVPTGFHWQIPFAGLRIGINAQYVGYRYAGEIGEIIVWPESLSQEDYDNAGSYLANKWGFIW
jgi:hypothetical protein